MAAEQLGDSFILSRIKQYSNIFKYHQKQKTCYSAYILKSNRALGTKNEPELNEGIAVGESSESYTTPKKRKKNISSS